MELAVSDQLEWKLTLKCWRRSKWWVVSHDDQIYPKGKKKPPQSLRIRTSAYILYQPLLLHKRLKPTYIVMSVHCDFSPTTWCQQNNDALAETCKTSTRMDVVCTRRLGHGIYCEDYRYDASISRKSHNQNNAQDKRTHCLKNILLSYTVVCKYLIPWAPKALVRCRQCFATDFSSSPATAKH